MSLESNLALVNTAMIVGSGAALIVGRVMIAKKRVTAHRNAMLTATALAAAFLITYVVRWATFGSTPFTGEGAARTAYFTILIGHSILATAIIPMVLVTLYRARKEDFAGHRKIARKTFPAWLVTAVSGWVIYWMLYHW